MDMTLYSADLKFIITEHFKTHKLNIGTIQFIGETVVAKIVPPTTEMVEEIEKEHADESKSRIDKEIALELKAYGKIQAIKKLRTLVANMSLFDAKNYVDYYDLHKTFKKSFR